MVRERVCVCVCVCAVIFTTERTGPCRLRRGSFPYSQICSSSIVAHAAASAIIPQYDYSTRSRRDLPCWCREQSRPPSRIDLGRGQSQAPAQTRSPFGGGKRGVREVVRCRCSSWYQSYYMSGARKRAVHNNNHTSGPPTSNAESRTNNPPLTPPSYSTYHQ